MPVLQYKCFAVNETPYCLWDWDISGHNLTFINSHDPKYFMHVAKINSDLLDGDERHYAATALRAAYFQGLESLFAILAATVQAPYCVIGWMLRYQNRDLFEVVRKINDRKALLSMLRPKVVTWESIAKVVHSPFPSGDKEKDIQMQKLFASLWQRFATDFLDENFSYEYNSIKHGLRIHSGGFALAIGLETEPGVPAPPEKMRPLGGSEFGSTFYIPEQLVNRNHFRVKRQTLGCDPKNFLPALNLISMSISNVISFLKIVNEVKDSDLRLECPSDDSYFEEPWQRKVRTTSFSMNSVIEEGWITAFSREKILSVYEETDSNAQGFGIANESALLAIINQSLPESDRERLAKLGEKRANETLTPEEQQELLALQHRLEALHAARMKALAQLAELRSVSLTAVMEQLGIQFPDHL